MMKARTARKLVRLMIKAAEAQSAEFLPFACPECGQKVQRRAISVRTPVFSNVGVMFSCRCRAVGYVKEPEMTFSEWVDGLARGELEIVKE